MREFQKPGTPLLHYYPGTKRLGHPTFWNDSNDLNCLNEFIRVALWRTKII
jgi:hypothetical protein